MASSSAAESTADTTTCAACWGVGAPSISQGIATAINHLFNSAFNWISSFPANPISDLISGALVLIRRTLFLVPTGVTASQAGTELTIAVNSGSVAYFRQDGTSVEVSGDPSFWGARQFDAATVADVVVGNGGNAGCAGFVLASGTVTGNLATSQIDSIRFDSDAAFTGTVSASLTGSLLTLRDAVRGLSGVTLEAAVVLGKDVDVDAGSGDATFTGTVDAASAGDQSLTVTALGTTTFKAAVGGQAALASLLTRGIAPIDIQQSSDSKTIPLHYLPEYNTNVQPQVQPQVKYGIDVAIGNNPSQMYEFDTGGAAFFAGYNRQLWQNVPLTTTGVSEAYSSGNYYDGVVSNTTITLGTGSQTVSTGQPIQIAAVLAGGNTNNDTTFDFSNPDVPPVESHFFGDFGASFGTMPVAGQDTPLANPLFQLPGNLSSGFLVQLGPIGSDPQLTVGVTDELRAQFPYAVPVSALVGGGTYPVSGYPVVQSFGFSPSYYAQLGTGPEMPIGTNQNPQCATQCLPSLIDSGAPSTGIRLKDAIGGDPYNDNGQLQTGVNFIARFPTTDGRAPLEWTFVAGDNGSVNLVNYQQGAVANPGQNVNTGLNLYNAFDVMFDVKEQVIWLRPTGGDSTVSLQSVTTTGDQNYQQSATINGVYVAGGGFSVAGVTTLLGDTVVDAGSGDVRFSGTVDGRHSLTVNSSGTTEFARGVGGLASLSSLTTDAGGSTSTAGVLTNADQRYNDAVTLNGQYQSMNGAFTVSGDTTLAGPVSVEATAGDITFGGAIDAQQGRGFSLTFTTGRGRQILLQNDVGSIHPLGGLKVLNPGGPANDPAAITAAGSITLTGDLGFTATQGISVADYVTTTLTGGGQVQSFAGDGISLGVSNGSQISGFVVSNNGGDGIAATGAENLQLENNAIIANTGDGIRATGVHTMTVTDSSVTGNTHNGIDARQASALTISSTTVSGNGDDGTGAQFNGVLLTGADHVTITGSTIGGNANDGILSSDSSTVAVTDNIITANGRYGVTVNTGTGNSILSNSIFANGPALGTTGFGISLQNGGNNDQSAPVIATATFAGGRIAVTGTLTLPDRYTGDYQIQVFYTASATQFTVQGQQLLGQAVAHFTDGRTASFSASFDASPASPGNYVTATATPGAGIPNTSQFSDPLEVRT